MGWSVISQSDLLNCGARKGELKDDVSLTDKSKDRSVTNGKAHNPLSSTFSQNEKGRQNSQNTTDKGGKQRAKRPSSVHDSVGLTPHTRHCLKRSSDHHCIWNWVWNSQTTKNRTRRSRSDQERIQKIQRLASWIQKVESRRITSSQFNLAKEV